PATEICALPYTTLFRSRVEEHDVGHRDERRDAAADFAADRGLPCPQLEQPVEQRTALYGYFYYGRVDLGLGHASCPCRWGVLGQDRKSTRLNSSHLGIS